MSIGFPLLPEGEKTPDSIGGNKTNTMNNTKFFIYRNDNVE